MRNDRKVWIGAVGVPTINVCVLGAICVEVQPCDGEFAAEVVAFIDFFPPAILLGAPAVDEEPAGAQQAGGRALLECPLIAEPAADAPALRASALQLEGERCRWC